MARRWAGRRSRRTAPHPLRGESGDLNPAGAVGNAAAASAEKGAAMVDHLARALVGVLNEARAFRLDRLTGE